MKKVRMKIQMRKNFSVSKENNENDYDVVLEYGDSNIKLAGKHKTNYGFYNSRSWRNS